MTNSPVCDHCSKVSHGLYVGSWQAVTAHNWDAVLCVMNDDTPYTEPDCPYLKIEAPDGPGFTLEHIDQAITFLRCQHGIYSSPRNVLIHCWSGYSRSVTVAACYLSHLNAGQFENLVPEIRKLRGKDGLPQPHVLQTGEDWIRRHNDTP